jgi:hypothetical protein
MPLFSNAWQIAWGRNSAFKTPHISPPRQPFGGVNGAAGSGGWPNSAPMLILTQIKEPTSQDFLLLSRQQSR